MTIQMIIQMDNLIIRYFRFECYYTKQTFLVDLLLTLSRTGNDPKSRSGQVRSLSIKANTWLTKCIVRIFGRNVEPLPFRFVERYNVSFIFQFTVGRFERSHELSERSRSSSKVIAIFHFQNPSPRSL